MRFLGSILGGGTFVVALVMSSVPVPAAAEPVADTVLTNGLIYTVDRENSVAQALAIRAGRIAYVGSQQGVQALIGTATKVIDLQGRMVMPGIIDTHNHPIGGGAKLLACDLDYAPLTVAEFRQKIQACLDDTGAKEPDHYLSVVGWYRQAMLPSGTQVTKADLDALETRRPILVLSTDGHTTLANSRAMEKAGIAAEWPDPHGGRIDRDAAGEPTGIFEDTAEGLVRSPMPPPAAADLLNAAGAALDALRRQGTTAFMAQNASRQDIQAWSTLREQGRLTARAYMAPDVDADAIPQPDLAVRRILDLKHAFDTGPIGPDANLWVRNAGEIFQDGVIQWPAQTASLLEPYLVNQGTDAAPVWVPGPSRGPDPYIPLEQLEPLLLALVRAGIDPEVHAIGDRAVRHTLDAYAYVRSQPGTEAARLQIAHAELVDPADYLRFQTLGVIPDMGFVWAKPGPDSIDGARDFLGPERFDRMEPEGHLNRIGVPITLGSDWPVDRLDQWYAMEVLITREGDLGGKYTGRLGTVPGVPLNDAIRAVTWNGAYALRSEADLGSLETGKLADLIVLDQNLLAIPVSRISDTKVLLTMVGGKVVYEDPSF